MHLIHREPQELEGVLVLWRLSGPDIALSDSRHGNREVMKRNTLQFWHYIYSVAAAGTNDHHPARTTESRTAVDSGEPRCEYGEEQKERMNRARR